MSEYDDGRIWYRKKNQVATVGLTEKGIAELGGIQSINLPVDGDEVQQDDVVGEIEGDKGTFEIIAPFEGAIDGVNESLVDDFDSLENDPLDEGWIFKIRIPKSEDEDEEESDEEED